MKDISDSYLETYRKEKGRDKERDANAYLNALNKIEIGTKEHAGVGIKESLQRRWERGGGLPMDSPKVRDIRDRIDGANENNLQRSRGDYLNEPNKIKIGTEEHAGDGIKENLQRGAAEQLIHEDYEKYITPHRYRVGAGASVGKEVGVGDRVGVGIDDDPSNLDEIIKGSGKYKLDSVHNLKDRDGKPLYGETNFYDRDIAVNRSTLNLQTDIHEGLHSHSYRDREKGIWGISKWNSEKERWDGGILDEGITDHFTYKTLEERGIQPHQSTDKYIQAREVADTIAKKYGEDVLAKAYFNGDIKGLEEAVDNDKKYGLGNGAFKEINSLLDKKDFEGANYILEHGLKD